MGEDILADDCSPQHANHEMNGGFPERVTVPRKRDEVSKGGKWRRERFVPQHGPEEKASAKEVGTRKAPDWFE